MDGCKCTTLICFAKRKPRKILTLKYKNYTNMYGNCPVIFNDSGPYRKYLTMKIILVSYFLRSDEKNWKYILLPICHSLTKILLLFFFISNGVFFFIFMCYLFESLDKNVWKSVIYVMEKCANNYLWRTRWRMTNGLWENRAIWPH